MQMMVIRYKAHKEANAAIKEEEAMPNEPIKAKQKITSLTSLIVKSKKKRKQQEAFSKSTPMRTLRKV
jgi:hypothetical protein